MKTLNLLLAAGFTTATSLFTTQAQAFIIGFAGFDGRDVNLSLFTQNPPPGAFASPWDIFEPVISNQVISNPFAMPIALADDTVVSVSGNSIFPRDSQAVVGRAKTDYFFGVVDLTNPQNPGGGGIAIFDFDFGESKALRSITLDVGAMGEFESSKDEFIFTAELDGEPLGNIFQFLPDESASFTYSPFDNGRAFSLDDPLVDQATGTILDKSDAATGALTTFSYDARGKSGRFLRIIFEADLDGGLDGGNKAFAFDNLTVNAVPEPLTILGTLASLGFGVLFKKKEAKKD